MPEAFFILSIDDSSIEYYFLPLEHTRWRTLKHSFKMLV